MAKGKILDLRPIIEETLDIILSEDKTIHLRKPTESLILRVSEQTITLAPGDDSEGVTDKERVDAINDLVADVLSRNTDGETFDSEWAANALPLGAKIAILEAYTDFAVSLGSNPN